MAKRSTNGKHVIEYKCEEKINESFPSILEIIIKSESGRERVENIIRECPRYMNMIQKDYGENGKKKKRENGK